jgi:type II secretion system protein L
MVPEYLAIPPPDAGAWFLDASETPMLLRMSEAEGGAAVAGAVGRQPPGELLLALEEAEPAPDTLNVRVTAPHQRELIAGWPVWLDQHKLQLDVHEDHRTRGAWMMQQPLPGSGNLLTGVYAPVVDGVRLLDRRLLPAAGLALALLLVAFANWIVQVQETRAQYRELQEAMTSAFLEAFPDARNLVVDTLRFRMEQQLTDLLHNRDQGGAGGDFLARLELLAARLEGSGDHRLEKLRYDGNSITLEVSVPDYDALDRLQKRLAGGAAVNVENAELREGRVYGRIQLRTRA